MRAYESNIHNEGDRNSQGSNLLHGSNPDWDHHRKQGCTMKPPTTYNIHSLHTYTLVLSIYSGPYTPHIYYRHDIWPIYTISVMFCLYLYQNSRFVLTKIGKLLVLRCAKHGALNRWPHQCGRFIFVEHLMNGINPQYWHVMRDSLRLLHSDRETWLFLHHGMQALTNVITMFAAHFAVGFTEEISLLCWGIQFYFK